METYLSSLNIDSTQFYNVAQAKKVGDLLYNPFYLIRLSQLFLQKRDLPQKNELMKELIDRVVNKKEKFWSIECNSIKNSSNLFLSIHFVQFPSAYL